MNRYNTTSLSIRDYEHVSEYLLENVLTIDCEVTYSWKDNALNNIDVDLSSVFFHCVDGDEIEVLPAFPQKVKVIIEQELEKTFAGEYWIASAK